MGGQLSSWYFSTGGLLMTEASRDAYFTLMEALRRAVTASGELAVQTVGQHAQRISLTLIGAYRQSLAKKGYPVFKKRSKPTSRSSRLTSIAGNLDESPRTMTLSSSRTSC